MVDIDITWRSPSEAQLKCLEWVMRRSKAARGKRRGWRAGISELQLAEGVLMAYDGDMLWNVQAEHWQLEPPTFYGVQMSTMFSAAAGLVVACTKHGPDAKGQWWSLDWLPDGKARQWAIACLVEFGYNLWVVQDAPRTPLQLISSNTMDIPVISRWFETFLDLVLGRGWEGRFTKLMGRMGKPVHPAFARMRQRDISIVPF